MVSAETLLWAILGAAIALAYMFVWAVSSRQRVAEHRKENERLKTLVDGSLAPGWWCPNPKCRLFNGDAKVRLQNCRGCDTPRP